MKKNLLMAMVAVVMTMMVAGCLSDEEEARLAAAEQSARIATAKSEFAQGLAVGGLFLASLVGLGLIRHDRSTALLRKGKHIEAPAQDPATEVAPETPAED